MATLAPPQPSLFKSNDVRVGVLSLGSGKGRSHQYTYGLDAVCDELSMNVLRTVTPSTVRVAINRGATVEQLRGIAAAKTIEDAVAIGGDLHAAGAGLRVSDVLTCEQPSQQRTDHA